MDSFLVIQTAFIGDAILASALVEKLHSTYPDAPIDLLVRKGNETLFERHPFLRRVLVWEKRRKKYNNLFHLLRHIRAQHYSVVVNCQRFAATGLLTAFSGAVQRIGFRSNPFSFLFTHRFPHRLGDGTHETERNQLLIAHLSDPKPAMPRLYPFSENEKVRAARSQSYYCVAPSSVWFTKQLPVDKWAGVVAMLGARARVFLIGAPSDWSICQRVIELSGCSDRCENLAGEVSLMDSAFLIQGANSVWVNDSAPLHLGSAVGTPVRAFFCSTVPAFGFGPLSPGSRVIETAQPLNCRPCGLHGKRECPQKHFDCGNTILISGELI